MAKVLVTDTNLTNIANAIRGKNGETTSYKVDEMAEAINNLSESTSGAETVTSFIGGDSPMDMITVTYVNENFEIVDVDADGDGFHKNGEVLKNSILVTSGATYNQFSTITGGIAKIYNNSTLCVWEVTGDFNLSFAL